MKKAAVLSILIAAILLAVAVIAEAQQQKKVPRIGVLFPGSPATFSPLRLARMASRPTCCFDHNRHGRIFNHLRIRVGDGHWATGGC